MLPIVAKKDGKRHIRILSDLEDGVAVLIYMAAGCKCGYPLVGSSDYWGEITPYWIAWILYLAGFLLIAFDASRTVCITKKYVIFNRFGGIISRQYEWKKILFWGIWQSKPEKQQYIYLSVKEPKHRLLFEPLYQCHLPYSVELYELITLLKSEILLQERSWKGMTNEELRINRRHYYAIRIIATTVLVLFSLVIMTSNAFEIWCTVTVIGLVVFIFYKLIFASILHKLEAEYYESFLKKEDSD